MMMVILLLLLLLLPPPPPPPPPIINKTVKTFLLIDKKIPSDGNIIQKEAEKKLKYKQKFSECGI
jgi:hypothetical protein